MLHICPLEDIPKTPWKNGMGITQEIIIFPHNATLDNFSWRVSVAHVHAAAPFSKYPNIHRYLTILSGSGLKLEYQLQTKELLPGEVFSFSGEEAINATMFDSDPLTDFGLMVNDAFGSGSITIHKESFSPPIANAWVIVTTAGNWTLHDPNLEQSHPLPAHHVVVCQAPDPAMILQTNDSTAELVCAHIFGESSCN